MADFPVQCGDCGAHFQMDPSGNVQGAACSECGGKRFFMDQPSPTHSDGTLRDMVDSDTQIDQGGNPLGEGTIMGTDAEQPMGKRDNFMHGHTASVFGDLWNEQTPEGTCPACRGEGSMQGEQFSTPCS